MLSMLREFCDALKFIPPSRFMIQPSFFTLTEDDQVKATNIFLEMPLYHHYVNKFGSWFKALVEAGVLGDGTQRLMFGTRCLANDGHECSSIAEKTIDDWLTNHNIHHHNFRFAHVLT